MGAGAGGVITVVDLVLFYAGFFTLVAMCFWLGKEYGRYQQATFDRRYDRRHMETFMANTARLEAAVAAAVALIAQLKASQENPADQAKIDELAGQLEQASQPPA